MSKSTRRTTKGKGKAKLSSTDKLTQEWDLDANRKKSFGKQNYLSIKRAPDGGLMKGTSRTITGAEELWKKDMRVAYWPNARVSADEIILDEFMRDVVGLSKKEIDDIFDNEVYTYETVYDDKSTLFSQALAEEFDDEVTKRQKFTQSTKKEDSSPWEVVMMFANITKGKPFTVVGETSTAKGGKTKTADSAEETFRRKYDRAEKEGKYLLVSALRDNFQGVTMKTDSELGDKFIKVPRLNIVSVATAKGKANFERAVKTIFGQNDAEDLIDAFEEEVRKRKMGTTMSSRRGTRRTRETESSGASRRSTEDASAQRRATRRSSVEGADARRRSRVEAEEDEPSPQEGSTRRRATRTETASARRRSRVEEEEEPARSRTETASARRRSRVEEEEEPARSRTETASARRRSRVEEEEEPARSRTETASARRRSRVEEEEVPARTRSREMEEEMEEEVPSTRRRRVATATRMREEEESEESPDIREESAPRRRRREVEEEVEEEEEEEEGEEEPEVSRRRRR